MSTLLYIKASPRDRSYSSRVAKEFLDSYKAAHPGDKVRTIDVFDQSIPEFNGASIQAKYAVLTGTAQDAKEKEAWTRVTRTAEDFKSADKFLFSVPMWNFGIPYALKKYLDVIIQPGLTFSFSPETGYTGLVSGKPAVVIYARGGEYVNAPNMDFQKPYLDFALGFIGITNVKSLVIEPTLAGGPDKANAKAEELIKSARDIARKF
jgi:FMN-dependent NADH-azoreductase